MTSIFYLPCNSSTMPLWCAGAIAVADHGLPGRLDILRFAVGAVAAFLPLALVGRPNLDVRSPCAFSRRPSRTHSLSW